MVVIIPKKRHCKKTLTVGGVALLMAVMVVACFTTGTKMTAWTDFVGMGAEGLEGGKSAIFPRSLSPLDYEKVIWSDSSESDNIEDGSEGVMEERDGVRDTDDEDTEPSDDLMGGGKVLVLDKREASLNLLDDFHLLVDNFNDSNVVDAVIESHLSICYRPQAQLEHVLSNISHPYHNMVTTGLKAFHTYVPQHYHPKFDNPCWFSSIPGLPTALHKNFTEYRGCMPNAMQTYTEQRAYEIVRLSVTTPANGARKIMDSLNLTHTAEIIPPQCQPLANQVSTTLLPDHGNSIMSANASKLFKECTYKYRLFCLPRVLIAGFPKCATSSMYYMMIKHPQIARPRMKEQHLFRDSFLDTEIKLPHKQIQMLYYIYHFEKASHEILMNPDHLTIDGSTTTIVPGLYLPYTQVEDICIMPKMVTKMIPSTKMIIMMRNPSDRLYSDYWYLCAKFSWKNGKNYEIPADYLKNATRVFHQMSVEMINSFNRCIKKESVFECVRQAGVGYAPEVACKGPRLGLSLYYFHIVRWLSILPREQILFIRTEDFITDPYSTMKSVYSFLGVSPPLTGHAMTELTYRNVNEWIKSTEYRKDFIMPKNTRNVLNNFFEPYNKMLSRLLKDDRYTWKDIQY